MPKIPDSVPVKVSISKITLEVPKSFFEQSALKAAIFIGRKGRSAATRRTKWFTLANPSLVPTRTRQAPAAPPPHHTASRQNLAGMPAAGDAEGGAEHHPHTGDVATEMAILEYSGLNNVVYEVDMKPLNVFDGDWVFDQKTTHPLTIFAKILSKDRPGVRADGAGNAAKTEQESNLHEVMQMDPSEVETNEDDSDNYSSENGEGGAADPALELSLSGMGLTGAQLAAFSGETDTTEMVTNQLRRGESCKHRYLQFPRTIDVATIVNTKAKSADFCERLLCKTASLLGATLSFTVAAELPREKLIKYEDRVKTKEEKDEAKRREKEEKLLEKERQKEDREAKRRREKEEKKSGKKEDKSYGDHVNEDLAPSGAKTEPHGAALAGATPTHPDDQKKKKGLFAAPLSVVKNIFTKEEKADKATPFTVKLTSTPYPFLVMLYDFQLSKLIMEPENYRAVHIRLGNDASSVDDFPRLLLDPSKPNTRTESTITWYDGSTRTTHGFDFGKARIFFGDKSIRHITGFETLRALQEHEQHYHEAKRLGDSQSGRRDSASSDLFREQLMNVGVHFTPIAFAPTKYSANDNQALATKFTRVTAQLVVAANVVGEMHQSDAAEKEAYIRKLKKEQRDKERAEKEAAKEAEKAAKKAAKEAAKKKDDPEAAETVEEAEAANAPMDGAAGTPNASANAAHQDSLNATKNSDDDGSNDKKPEGEGQDVEPSVAELGASEEVAPVTTPEKEKKVGRDAARIVNNQTSSFQLSTYVINEDYVPEEGVPYRILFQTGEELTFKARRFFLPSVCAFGDDGCTREPTLAQFLGAHEVEKE